MSTQSLTPEQIQMLQYQMNHMEPDKDLEDGQNMQDFAESIAQQMQSNNINYSNDPNEFNQLENERQPHLMQTHSVQSSYLDMIPKQTRSIALVMVIMFVLLLSHPLICEQFAQLRIPMLSSNVMAINVLMAVSAGALYYAGYTLINYV